MVVAGITGYAQSLLFSHFFVPSPRAILGTKEILSVGGRRKLWNIYTTPTISSLAGYCQLTNISSSFWMIFQNIKGDVMPRGLYSMLLSLTRCLAFQFPSSHLNLWSDSSPIRLISRALLITIVAHICPHHRASIPFGSHMCDHPMLGIGGRTVNVRCSRLKHRWPLSLWSRSRAPTMGFLISLIICYNSTDLHVRSSLSSIRIYPLLRGAGIPLIRFEFDYRSRTNGERLR